MTFHGVSSQAFQFLSSQLSTAGTSIKSLGGGNFEFEGQGVKCKVAFEVSTGTLEVTPDNWKAKFGSGQIQAKLQQHLNAYAQGGSAQA